MIGSRFHNMAIRHKLMVMVMIGTTVALLLTGTAFVISDRMSFEKTFLKKLQSLADVIGYTSTAALTFADQAEAGHILMGLKEEPSVVGAFLFDSSGHIFASFRPRVFKDTTYPTADLAEPVIVDGVVTLSRPIEFDGNPIGRIVIQATTAELYALAGRNMIIMIAVTLLALFVSFGIMKRLQRIVTDPVLHLTAMAERVSSEGDYSQRAVVAGHDELGFLTRSFNDMLSQIQIRDEQLQELTGKLEQRVQQRTRELELEIMERTRAEAEVKASLAEKEVLLKEIHHRVKNNLQIINSLLNLQASKIADEQLAAVFSDSQGRVKSMALIHEMLYKSENLSEISFPDYVDGLIKFLMSTVSGKMGRVTIAKSIEDIHLAIDQAIPCGLMINELVTNSLKYAFPQKREGEIRVECRLVDDGDVHLTVSDNGVGLPPGFDPQKTGTLGMQLVHSLILQLDGRVEFSGDDGVTFRIQFGRTQRKAVGREAALA